jgi:hypothetical protein
MRRGEGDPGGAEVGDDHRVGLEVVELDDQVPADAFAVAIGRGELSAESALASRILEAVQQRGDDREAAEWAEVTDVIWSQRTTSARITATKAAGSAPGTVRTTSRSLGTPFEMQ